MFCGSSDHEVITKRKFDVGCLRGALLLPRDVSLGYCIISAGRLRDTVRMVQRPKGRFHATSNVNVIIPPRVREVHHSLVSNDPLQGVEESTDHTNSIFPVSNRTNRSRTVVSGNPILHQSENNVPNDLPLGINNGINQAES